MLGVLTQVTPSSDTQQIMEASMQIRTDLDATSILGGALSLVLT